MNINETERLVLQNFTLDDAEFIIELTNSPGWINIGNKGMKTLDEANKYISVLNKSYDKYGYGLYIVRLKDNTPIGMCGLVKRDYLEFPDIGFALLGKYFKKGFGLESSLAVMNYAKNILNLDKILAITDSENNDSISLLKKIGMIYQKNILPPNKEKELMLFSNFNYSVYDRNNN